VSQITAELDPSGKRIHLTFSYDVRIKDTIKYKVPNSRFIAQDKGGPAWSVPLDLITGRILRKLFDKQLVLGPNLLQWGRDEVQRERNLSSMALADDAELVYAPKTVPELCALIEGDGTENWPDRPYQRADIAFLAAVSAINANQMGLGKTIEVIGAIHEAQMERGEHLIIAPKTALESVWQKELELYSQIPVFTLYSETSTKERRELPEQIMEAVAVHGGYAFVTTASMVRSKKWRDVFLEANWTSITIDEYHKTGLCEGNSQFSKLSKAMIRKEQKRIPMSGTPMGGKPIKLWSALNFIDPDRFSSKWKWAEQWLDVEKETIRVRGGGTRTASKIGGLREGSEAAFYAYHAPYLVRRLKSEVADQLPPKQQVEVLCEMSPKQTAQYREFARAAEIRIEEQHLSATNILTEYLRLKQFANAVCLVHEYEVACQHKKNEGMSPGCPDCLGMGLLIKQKLIPTEDSGKLPQLLQKLNEIGIDPDDPEGDAQTIIASQFKEMVDMVAAWLERQGIPVAKITGDTTGKRRTQIQQEFQKGIGPRVVCMTTTAGGVSITLDKADTCHILDETWNPDDQQQLEDRIHRISRIHQVTVYYYRSKNTIEQYIQDTTATKTKLNDIVLDIHRRAMKNLK
jgi:SNF2 family DNA or RNA helicase